MVRVVIGHLISPDVAGTDARVIHSFIPYTVSGKSREWQDLGSRDGGKCKNGRLRAPQQLEAFRFTVARGHYAAMDPHTGELLLGKRKVDSVSVLPLLKTK